MRVYYSVLKLRLINGLQYRVAALAGMSTQLFWGLIFIMIYDAFYSSGLANLPMDFDEVVTYIWLQQAFLTFIMLWMRDTQIFELITSGNIAYELCRPCQLYGFWYAKLLAQRLSGAVLRCFPIMLIAFLIPAPYSLSLPPSLLTLGLFMVTLLLGVLVLVAISMFIYISVFYTLSPVGSLLVFGVVGEFMAGLILPVPMMPEWLQRIVYLLPFRLSCDLPFRVYSGHIPTSEALNGILLQVGWLLALVWVGNLALQASSRRVVVQGG